MSVDYTPAQEAKMRERWNEFDREEGRYARLNATSHFYCALCGGFLFFLSLDEVSRPVGAVHGVMGEGGVPDRCDLCFMLTAEMSEAASTT